MTTTNVITCGEYYFNVLDLTISFDLFRKLHDVNQRFVTMKYTYFKYDRRVLRYMDSIYFISEAA